jgi:hypothetical protein
MITTDWKKAFFAAERRLSPQLEKLVRTEAFLDAVSVANGLTRLTTRTARDAGNRVVEALGLPSSRQVQRLQRSIDAMNRARQ